MELIYAVIFGFAIRKFYLYAFTKPVPQSPAALGLAFACIVLAFIICSAISEFLMFFAIEGIITDVAIFLSSIVCAVGAGFLSARTTEDTKSMNAKIIAVVGFPLYIAITTISFQGEPVWLNYSTAILYIPAIIGGYFIYTKMPNKNSQQDAVERCRR